MPPGPKHIANIDMRTGGSDAGAMFRTRTVEENQIPRWKLDMLAFNTDPTERDDGPTGRGMVSSVARKAASEAFNKKVKGFSNAARTTSGGRPGAVGTPLYGRMSDTDWDKVMPGGKLKTRPVRKALMWFIYVPVLAGILTPVLFGFAAAPALIMLAPEIWSRREHFMAHPEDLFAAVHLYYSQ